MKQTITICDACGRKYDTHEYTLPMADITTPGLYAKTVDLCDICAVRIASEFYTIRYQHDQDHKE